MQQAASQNKYSDTSCMEDLEGEAEAEGGEIGAEVALIRSKSGDRNSEKEKERDDANKEGPKSDANCV